MSRNKPRTSSPEKAVLDIIVTTAGRFDMLKLCLEKLDSFKQNLNFNVYLVDNASNSDERLQNEELFMWVHDKGFHTKRLQQNVGFPGAANEGARMGSSPLIMFLSDDVILDTGAIEKILGQFADTKVGIVGIKLLFPDNSTSPARPAGKVQHIGLCLNIRGEPIHPLIGWSPTHPKTCISREVFAVTGACFTIRREIFQRLGGFNMIYGRGTFEDLTLCLQTKALGYKIVVNTDAIGHHYVGATAEKRNEPFPLQYNNMLFQSQFSQSGLMAWEEDKFW